MPKLTATCEDTASTDGHNARVSKKGRTKDVERRVLIGVAGAAITAILAIGALAVTALCLDWERFWPNAGQPFATVLGGLAVLGGGALALYNGRATRDHDRGIASTEQRHETTKELNSRFTTASGQLGNQTSAAIRQAGAYALAALANDWDQQEDAAQKQVCIDVLCGYLRSTDQHPADETTTPPRADNEVKATIQQIIADHLRPEQDKTTGRWSTNTIDLSDTDLRNVNFKNCQFLANAKFDNAKLLGNSANFTYAHFAGAASFNKTTFKVATQIRMDHIKFTGTSADFYEASFAAATDINFFKATFKANRTNFIRANFNAIHIGFEGAQFKSSQKVSFGNVKFRANELSFEQAVFNSPRTNFFRVTFDVSDRADFRDIQIIRDSTIDFSRPKYWDNTKMIFNWGDDATQAPDSVFPDEWPPTDDRELEK